MDINKTNVISDPIAGSGLAASQDIGSGDVIIQLSSPYLLVVEKEALENVCSFCLIEASSVDMPLKRCSACRVPRYCSSECQKKDWIAVHQKECPILKNLPDIPPTPVRALMQLLLRHRHGTSLDPRWAGLESHVEDLRRDRERWDEIVLQAQAAVGFSKSPQDRIEVAVQILCRMITNAFRATLADDSPVGLCFEPILALANHSCSPNAVVVFDGRSVALRTLEPIEKGEQVFISYITATEDRTSRQRDLKQRYFFDCQCEKCREDESPYSTFLRYAPKSEGKIDLFCNSEYLIRNAKNILSDAQRTTARENGHPADLDKATKYLYQSQAPDVNTAGKKLLLIKAANLCDSRAREFARHPMPKIIHELYLTSLDGNSYLNALVVLLFLFLNCDVYNYPQPHHPVRVIRLFTIAKLLKHVSSLSPETLAEDPKRQPKLHQAIEDIDWINSFHAVMILVWEQGAKSHGNNSRFMKEVENELRDVEEVQRLRGEVGANLRDWMISENGSEGRTRSIGRKEAEEIFLSLRNISECAWEIVSG